MSVLPQVDLLLQRLHLQCLLSLLLIDFFQLVPQSLHVQFQFIQFCLNEMYFSLDNNSFLKRFVTHTTISHLLIH